MVATSGSRPVLLGQCSNSLCPPIPLVFHERAQLPRPGHQVARSRRDRVQATRVVVAKSRSHALTVFDPTQTALRPTSKCAGEFDRSLSERPGWIVALKMLPVGPVPLTIGEYTNRARHHLRVDEPPRTQW